MSLGGIILAGGASRRMGQVKALLRVGEETFADRLIGLLKPYCETVILVAGAHAAVIAAGLARRQEVTLVVNPEPERGMLSSLQCGVAALPAGMDGFLFTPVDLPRLQAATIEQIARLASESKIAIPRRQGRGGHPVLVPQRLAPALLAMPTTATPRDFIERHRPEVTYVEVEDTGIFLDVDTPADYAALTA